MNYVWIGCSDLPTGFPGPLFDAPLVDRRQAAAAYLGQHVPTRQPLHCGYPRRPHHRSSASPGASKAKWLDMVVPPLDFGPRRPFVIPDRLAAKYVPPLSLTPVQKQNKLWGLKSTPPIEPEGDDVCKRVSGWKCLDGANSSAAVLQ